MSYECFFFRNYFENKPLRDTSLMYPPVGSFGESSLCEIHHTVSILHERYTCSHQIVLTFQIVAWIQRHQEVTQCIHEYKFSQYLMKLLELRVIRCYRVIFCETQISKLYPILAMFSVTTWNRHLSSTVIARPPFL